MNFRATKPDPRILILQIILGGVFSFYFKNSYAVFGFFLAIDLLVLFFYGARQFFNRLITYAFLNILIGALTNIHIPILSVIFPAFLMMVVRIFPVYLLLKLLLDRAPMDELLYTLDAIHVPKALSIPIMVVYRYVPTILQDFRNINECLKMRGLNVSLANAGHLIQTVERYMVPLLFRSEKIAEELSAASLCKGLSVSRKRTCCTDVKLNVYDLLYVVGMFAVIGALIYLDYLNFY